MKIRHFILLASAGLLLNACDSMDTQTKQWLGTDSKDPDVLFNKMPGPDVDSVNATLEKQAKDAADKGDLQRAGQFYEQLMSSKKGTEADKLRYKIAYADMLRRIGQNDKALAKFDEILGDTPNDLDAQEGRALTLMSMGKATDAGRAFSDIMEKDGKRWRTLNALGILFVTKNMVPEAMAYFTEAMKYSPDNPAVLNNVGLSQAVDKNYARGIQALEQASRLAKSGERRKQVDLNLALVYASSGDVDTAKEIAAKYLEGPELDNNLGLYAHLAKDDALAKTYLNMALTDSDMYYKRAWENLDFVDKNGADGDSKEKKKK